jgi:hypothetical protein
VDWPGWIAQHSRHLARAVTVAEAPASRSRTRVHRYQAGPNRLLAFERNVDYHMSEDLKQAGGNEALEKPVEVEAKLAQAAHVYDLRARKHLGRTDHFTFRLDPWQPSLFALTTEPVAEDRVVELLLAQAPSP